MFADPIFQVLSNFLNSESMGDICAVTLARFTGEKGADISSQNIFWTTQ
jgi:hypothetical protein